MDHLTLPRNPLNLTEREAWIYADARSEAIDSLVDELAVLPEAADVLAPLIVRARDRARRIAPTGPMPGELCGIGSTYADRAVLCGFAADHPGTAHSWALLPPWPPASTPELEGQGDLAGTLGALVGALIGAELVGRIGRLRR